VREILADCIPGCPFDPEEMQAGHDLTDDLEADSLDLVEAALALEEAFGIEISDATAEGFETVGDIVDFIAGQEARRS
jgi:acyl carrier protein